MMKRKIQMTDPSPELVAKVRSVFDTLDRAQLKKPITAYSPEYSPELNTGGVAPIAVSFMLAFHASTKPISELGHDHYYSIAGQGTVKWLLDNGFIEVNSSITCPYRPTEKGCRWVSAICHAPRPMDVIEAEVDTSVEMIETYGPEHSDDKAA